MNDQLAYEILSIVAEIPSGQVATYGQVAALSGHPRGARLVGRVLRHAMLYGDFPCHRVVDHSGRLAPGWTEQAALLAAEGVPMKDSAHVNLKLCRWAP